MTFLKRVMITVLFSVVSEDLDAQKFHNVNAQIICLASKFNNEFLTEYYYMITNDSMFHVTPYLTGDNMPCFQTQRDSVDPKLIMQQSNAELDLIKRHLDKQKYKTILTTGKKEYEYYWKCIQVTLDFALLKCSAQKNPLSSIVNNEVSFVPLRIKGKIKKGKVRDSVMNKIIGGLQ